MPSPPPNDVVALLQELIRIPSVNPEADPDAPPEHAGEQRIAEYVASFLEQYCGATATLEEVQPGRPNVVARFPHTPDMDIPRAAGASDSSGPLALVFGPHLDTVSVSGMTVDPFAGDIRDGKIFGRGASDTKGSMAAMLWALHQLRDLIPTLNARVMFAGFMGEEYGQPGSRHFAERHANETSFGVVGEPTGLDIVATHKGCLWARITTTGRAAHGSTPELGDNAIHKMARLIQTLDTDFRPALAAHTHPDLGPATINIGTIRGGAQPNIVADNACIEVDLRLPPGITANSALEKLTDFVHSAEPAATVDAFLKTDPLDTDPAHPVVQRLLTTPKKRGDLSAVASAKAEAASAPGLSPAPWFCDAAILAEAGIPAIAIGPGSIAQAHTDDEFLAIEDLRAAADFFQHFLESLAPE